VIYALRATNPAFASLFSNPGPHGEECIFALLPQLAAAKHDALAERGGAILPQPRISYPGLQGKKNLYALLAAAKPMRFGAAGKGLHKRLTNGWFCTFTYFNHLRQLG
jgi:hypothetical protein